MTPEDPPFVPLVAASYWRLPVVVDEGEGLSIKERLRFFVVPIDTAEEHMCLTPGVLKRIAEEYSNDSRLRRWDLFYQDGEDLYVDAIRLSTEILENPRFAVAWEDANLALCEEFVTRGSVA